MGGFCGRVGLDSRVGNSMGSCRREVFMMWFVDGGDFQSRIVVGREFSSHGCLPINLVWTPLAAQRTLCSLPSFFPDSHTLPSPSYLALFLLFLSPVH